MYIGEIVPKPSLLQAEQSQLSQPFLMGEGSSPLIIFVASYWTLSSMPVSLLYWGAQNWTQCSRCGPTSAEQRRRITSLNPLAMFCLMQSRIPFAFFVARARCWLMFILVSTRIPRSFSVKLLPRSLGQAAGRGGTRQCCQDLHPIFDSATSEENVEAFVMDNFLLAGSMFCFLTSPLTAVP